MNRWGRRSTKIKKRKLFFISFLIILLILFETFLYIERQLEPILMSIAKARVKQIGTNAVNDAISQEIAQDTEFEDLIQFKTDKDGNITAAIFNYSEFARIVGESTERIESTLNDLETFEEKIKLGALFNSDILSDLGPAIPITIVPIGSARVSPSTTYQNAGINVTIMTVVINIKAELQVVIPFVSDTTVIESSVPIAQTQIFGKVPQFYYDGSYYSQSPSDTQNAPPIQIVPAVPVVPGEGQAQDNAIPSASNYINNNAVPGFEQFYPIIQGSSR